MEKHPENHTRRDSADGLRKEAPFRVPEGYFEGLTERVLDRLELSDPSTNVRPHPFAVPEGYFERLSASVMERISAQPKTAPVIIPLYTKKTALFAVAAAIACTIFLYRFSHRELLIEPATGEFVTLQELQESYLADDLDESTLQEAVATLSSQESNTDRELQEYLIENGVELSQIDI